MSLAKTFLKPDYRVCDICCGRGFTTRCISKYSKDVIGIDNCRERISDAKSLWPEGRFVLSDVLDFLKSDSDPFDAICCFDGLEHIGECQQRQFLNALDPRLKSDGVVIFNLPNSDYTDYLRNTIPQKLQPVDNAPSTPMLINDMWSSGFCCIFLYAYSIEAKNQYYFMAFKRRIRRWEILPR